MGQPYSDFVARFASLLRKARRLPRGGFKTPRRPAPRPDAPRVLILAPHPDDECIVGVLPLRLQRELGCAVGVVAATYGSKRSRRAARLRELRGACGYLGWELIERPDSVERDLTSAALAAILRDRKPDLLLLPHAADANATHRRVHRLGLAALGALGKAFRGAVAETEFWSTLEDPNLMIEASAAQTADLVAALSFHRGEVARNPYHVLLPCWLADGVRRGGELVGGQGAGVPKFRFAAVYRWNRWNGRGLTRAAGPGRIVPVGRGLRPLFSR
ncbi:MAG: PIG-L family deacetylase [Elusimicrobia bacterium]|nr:PIG-L family deacetylase [Elusimicrobiota bacterium]